LGVVERVLFLKGSGPEKIRGDMGPLQGRYAPSPLFEKRRPPLDRARARTNCFSSKFSGRRNRFFAPGRVGEGWCGPLAEASVFGPETGFGELFRTLLPPTLEPLARSPSRGKRLEWPFQLGRERFLVLGADSFEISLELAQIWRQGAMLKEWPSGLGSPLKL